MPKLERFVRALGQSLPLVALYAVIWGISQLWQAYRGSTVSPFSWFDGLITNSWSPFFTALFVGVLVVIWLRIPFDIVWERWLSRQRREFLEQFNDPENARARHAFRMLVWAAYRNFDSSMEAHQFPALIEKIKALFRII